ncbi:predicted protein [Nematostella vectensis]|uniref:WD repeat domain-containing protein 83 n=1 Tax=Nematostella vectensis TaxID=45351 RepID=A7SKD9_NEMVE|nr:WD repeat domain-containing protein 83 [Nematostella vectensis]EDO35821.1 predicted protein [Nematostella vectensis]|eukprot:XP_001627884.1 predicted protein [Nematostella vectensis]
MSADAKLPSKQTGLLQGHQGAVRAVRFNSDGNYCLTCGSDKILALWNPHKATRLKTYSGHGYEVLDAVAAGDSSRIASCSADRTVVLWDVSTGQVIRRYRGHTSRVNCVKFNQPDSTVIISGSYDSTIRCWDCRSRSQEPVQVIDDAKDSVTSVHVSSHEILSGSVDCKVRNYDIRMGTMHADCIGEPVTSVTFTQDGQCILVSSLDNTVRLMDKDTGELLNEFKGHQNKEYKLDSCLNHTDTHVISGSEDGSIHFWDLIEAKLIFSLEKAHKGVAYSLSYHPKDSCLLSASSDGEVKVWHEKEWEPS